MKAESTSFQGWTKVLRLSNGSTELLVTTEVGPRIISYQTQHRGNILKVIESECGSSNEEGFLPRGGHRLWLAPEDWISTYHVDNREVKWSQQGSDGEVVFESNQTDPILVRKSLGVHLDPEGSGVTVKHTIRNEGGSPLKVATWGVTLLRAGGLTVVPQPELGSHPQDIIPNRGIVLWPYTDLGDTRINFNTSFWLFQQFPDEEGRKLKIGIAHRQNWVAHISDDLLFLKKIQYDSQTSYPDGGCNLEIFIDNETTQLESLGALVSLGPGQSTSHTERWYLFPLDEPVTIESEAALARWLTPYIKQI